MKHVARDEHHVWPERNDPVYRLPKRVGHVRLSLIDASRSQTLILPVTEM